MSKINPLERNDPVLVVTKYMGSKKAILGFVADELERLTEPGDIIVDLMAGTHTIGYAMKKRCQIVANDIQQYSLVIGNLLLNYKPEPRFKERALTAFERYYSINLRHLKDTFNTGLRAEKTMLSKEPGKEVPWQIYHEFCSEYPYFMRPEQPQDWPEDFLLLYSPQRVAAYRTLNKLEPYSLLSLYYPNTYLGVRQCIEVDSLRFAIDKLCDEWVPEHEEEGFDSLGLRCLLLSALISTLSRVNPGPGHWAAYSKVSEKNQDFISAQRRLDAHSIFLKKVREFEAALALNPSPYSSHIVANDDYITFMTEVREYIRQAKVVYLDPPYSQGHYSRFYHLIETLVQYDYPEISHEGRYRINRHQSPFAQKSKVAEAIGVICETARKSGTILVISYSKGGIVPDEKAFIKILRNYYPAKRINVKRLSSVHSKLGQAKRMKTEEYIYTCMPRSVKV